jgi:hypothetical protein
MVRAAILAGVFATLGAVAVFVSHGAAAPADEKIPTVGTVMSRSFGKDGYKSAVLAAVKNDRWEDAHKLAREWNELGRALGKNKAPKGDEKSWEKLCAGFAENTKAILDATEKMDAKAANAKLGGFNCGICHKAHK